MKIRKIQKIKHITDTQKQNKRHQTNSKDKKPEKNLLEQTRPKKSEKPVDINPFDSVHLSKLKEHYSDLIVFILQQLSFRLVRITDIFGRNRIVEQYQIYCSRRGKILLHCYQLAGWSKSGVTQGWKNLNIDTIKQIKPVEAFWNFRKTREEYNPYNTYMMIGMYFHLPKNVEQIKQHEERRVPQKFHPNFRDIFNIYTVKNNSLYINYRIRQLFKNIFNINPDEYEFQVPII